MTREEAIAKLKNFADHCDPNDVFLMAIEALSAEPCEDAISRQAVLDELEKWDWQELYLPIHFKQILDDLPPVTPKQKMGHWEEKSYYFERCTAECSVCGERTSGTGEDTGWGFSYSFPKYCSNCGAKMVEPQESEDT